MNDMLRNEMKNGFYIGILNPHVKFELLPELIAIATRADKGELKDIDMSRFFEIVLPNFQVQIPILPIRECGYSPRERELRSGCLHYMFTFKKVNVGLDQSLLVKAVIQAAAENWNVPIDRVCIAKGQDFFEYHARLVVTWILRHACKMSYKSIAKIVGVSESTVCRDLLDAIPKEKLDNEHMQMVATDAFAILATGTRTGGAKVNARGAVSVR